MAPPPQTLKQYLCSLRCLFQKPDNYHYYKVTTLANFFTPGSNTLMNYETFKDSTRINIDKAKYIDIRYIIKLSLQKLRLSESRLAIISYPLIPTLIDIALATKKGCGLYYRILNKKKCIENKIGKREEKWHTELESVLSVTFWEKIRHLNSTINFDNPNKWLQFQIIRNSLQTNYIVSHFIRNVSPLCKFCGIFNEKISHIFWFCPTVKSFLNDKKFVTDQVLYKLRL